jgi:hypothetical protein
MRVALFGSGPSFTLADAERCRGAVTIALNSTILTTPWADVCFSADYHWWDARQGLPWYTGRKVGLENYLGFFNRTKYPDIQVYKPGRHGGLECDPERLATGLNSGYAAINYAVHCGATQIILLGYDMQATDGNHHHHVPHNEGDPHPAYDLCLRYFDTLQIPLLARGVVVQNASRSTAMTTFPCVSLEEALDRHERRPD